MRVRSFDQEKKRGASEFLFASFRTGQIFHFVMFARCIQRWMESERVLPLDPPSASRVRRERSFATLSELLSSLNPYPLPEERYGELRDAICDTAYCVLIDSLSHFDSHFLRNPLIDLLLNLVDFLIRQRSDEM